MKSGTVLFGLSLVVIAVAYVSINPGFFLNLMMNTRTKSSESIYASMQHAQVKAPSGLLEFNSEYIPSKVIRVTEGIHVAVGYGLANTILIEGKEGSIIVDTMESINAAKAAKEALSDLIAKKPVKAIIYTHNHADHVAGATVFASDDPKWNQSSNGIAVYSHASTLAILDQTQGITGPITYKRAMRQFGVHLRGTDHINSGIGPRLVSNKEGLDGLIRPNHVFDGKRMEVIIEGVTLHLLHAPGETDDQIVVWIPEKRALLAADNFYKCFPNLYAIRGTPNRDTMQWVRTIDEMRALRPEYLIPSHTTPLTGAKEIYQALTAYRDAIQYVHDQTVQHINKGLTPDEIVELVKLPSHLQDHPYLQQFYGTVEWSVRSIFTGYLGWFSGRAVDLSPLPPREKAQNLIEFGGGKDAVLQKAKDALSKGSHQWALELAEALLLLEGASTTDIGSGAKSVKLVALRALASKQTSANGRNYYLTQALETEGLELSVSPTARNNFISTAPLPLLFKAMALNIDPVKSLYSETSVRFSFTDTKQVFILHVRRGICEFEEVQDTERREGEEKADIAIVVDSTVWRELMVGTRNVPTAYLNGDFVIEKGTSIQLVGFLLLFRAPADV